MINVIDNSPSLELGRAHGASYRVEVGAAEIQRECNLLFISHVALVGKSEHEVFGDRSFDGGDVITRRRGEVDVGDDRPDMACKRRDLHGERVVNITVLGTEFNVTSRSRTQPRRS